MARRRRQAATLGDGFQLAIPGLELRCRHDATTFARRHYPAPGGRACSHLEECNACGAVVGSESFSLVSAAGRKAHAAEYPPARQARARQAPRARRRKGVACT